MSILEIKLEKIREKHPNSDLNVKTMKKSEINKCNEYCKKALEMFSHFTFLYAKPSERSSMVTINNFENLSIQDLVDNACFTPDESNNPILIDFFD